LPAIKIREYFFKVEGFRLCSLPFCSRECLWIFKTSRTGCTTLCFALLMLISIEASFWVIVLPSSEERLHYRAEALIEQKILVMTTGCFFHPSCCYWFMASVIVYKQPKNPEKIS
jgi:hypothetical protein